MGPLSKGALVTPTPPAHLVYSLLTAKTSTALTCAGSVGGGMETPAHGLTPEQRGTFGGDPYYVRYRPNVAVILSLYQTAWLTLFAGVRRRCRACSR